jgi:hypothetical protein
MADDDELDDEPEETFTSITTAVCPHCNAVLTFPGFDVIYAFVCSNCGQGVDLKAERVQ